MLKQIDYWLKGYIRVKITGRKLERLINLLIAQQIELWDVIRIEEELYTNIKLEEQEKLKKYLDRINCNYEVINYYGLPHIVKRLLNRRFVMVGIIIFIVGVHILSSFVFFIEIKGTKKLSQQDLKTQLLNLKVRPGVLKSSISLEKLEEIIIEKNRRIAWANLYFKGTKLVLEVVEKKIIDTQVKPNDIVAKKSGLITELIVFRGTPLVEEGTTVKKGQVLISQVVKAESEQQDEGAEKERITETRQVKAAGIAKAKVWYSGYGEAALIETFMQPTAASQKNLILKYENKEIILSGPQKPPYNYFFIEENIKSLAQWRNISFPLEIITKKYIKLKRIRAKRSVEQAKELAKEKAVESILQQLTKEVIIMNSELKLIKTKKEENLVRVKAILEVEEDIATRRE